MTTTFTNATIRVTQIDFYPNRTSPTAYVVRFSAVSNVNSSYLSVDVCVNSTEVAAKQSTYAAGSTRDAAVDAAYDKVKTMLILWHTSVASSASMTSDYAPAA